MAGFLCVFLPVCSLWFQLTLHPQSWFIGKVPTANTPATPNPLTMSSNLSASIATDAEAGNGGGNITSVQVSPMSSAFPPMQGRTTAAVG